MTAVPSLQRTLAGEYAAVYCYGVIGGRVSASRHPVLATRVAQAYTTHRARRDQLIGMVRDAGATPVASAVSYELPGPATSPQELAGTATELERRCARLYADMVQNTSLVHRQWAIDALADAAVRQLGFSGSPSAFPGVPGLPY